MRTFLLSLALAALHASAAPADDTVTGRQGDKGKEASAASVTPSPPHVVTPSSPAAAQPPVPSRVEGFEIRDGDRVLFLGDTLLEREGTYGYLETRMAEQFPDRKFTVRNLAFSADTPLGWSRASFDPAAKGFERLKEQLALVKPTVVFLGYGMAASLQEMTDRSQDWTLNRDPARYGAPASNASRSDAGWEPMSAARFKKELAQCMDAIEESAKGSGFRDQESGKDVEPARSADPAVEKGSARAPRAVPGAPPGTSDVARPPQQDTPSAKERKQTSDASGGAPDAARGARALPDARKSANHAIRFVLLSPIRHEDLRAMRPGLPDPTEHNKLLEQYTKAIKELAKERGARFVDAGKIVLTGEFHRDATTGEFQRQLSVPFDVIEPLLSTGELLSIQRRPVTDNGIHLHEEGYRALALFVGSALGWTGKHLEDLKRELAAAKNGTSPLRTAVIRKNELFFHRWRPANETYLFGFRKREQGKNGAEIPMFDPLIEKAEAEIERLKKGGTASAQSSVPSAQSAQSAIKQPPAPDAKKSEILNPKSEIPSFTLADGLEISLWAENPLLAKPTEMNWDAQGRLWVASSAMYPMIAPGQVAFDKIIILEDPGHTGKATKSTVFVDGLLIPTGVAPVLVEGESAQSSVPSAQKSRTGTLSPLSTDALSTGHSRPARWGCYVGQSTELLYFEDTDGDGKADKKRIVFSGFGTEDTHHIVHTLRWGPDGRLYFSQSVYIHTHIETPWGVVRLNSGGTFAYDPRTERVEVVQRGLWNTWGHAWDQWGQSFHTDGAGSSGISWAWPGATFAPFEGARRTMASISPGSYPKFAGLELIYSPHFPLDWQGSAVTCDFRAHKIVHFNINDLGQESGKTPAANLTPDPRPLTPDSSPKSGYITEQLPVLVQTSDATFRPIDVKLGPDGALYIADWSNPIINHGEVDFRDPRRDHEHGRIWRLSVKGGAAVKWESLVGKRTEELFGKLLSENLWEKDQARSLNRTQDTQEIRKWAETITEPKQKDIAEYETALAIYPSPWGSALREMEVSGLGGKLSDSRKRDLMALSLVFFRVSQFNDAGIRAAFAQMGPPFQWGGIVMSGINDPNPRVRIDAMRTLARIPNVGSASLILDAAVNAPKDDPYYEFAAWLSINDLAPQVAEWVEKNSADTASAANAPNAGQHASGSARAPRAVPGASPGTPDTASRPNSKQAPTGSAKTSDASGGAPNAAGGAPALPDAAKSRDAKISLALQSLPPETSGPLLAKILAARLLPRDGSGPWIDLIGTAGGPGELRLLLDALLAATTPDGEKPKPLADAKHRFTTPDANRRAAAALVAAARRGVKPTGVPLGDWRFYFYAPEEALPDIIRLAGLWKENVNNAIGAHMHSDADPKLLDACFETLRVLGTAEAAMDVAAYLGVNLDGKADQIYVEKASAKASPALRRRALVALATLRPAEAMKQLRGVLQETGERDQQPLWRDLFASAPFLQNFTQKLPDGLPPASYVSALRVAREMGRKAQPLVAKLAPLVGEKAADTAPADYADLAARAKKDGDPVAGEAMYRRTASACTTCHAIGGAGGKLGPDMTSIGASAPLDYIVESILNPAAKVKEGYHAFSFTMKDGTEAIGIPSRETAQEQFIRTLAGEQGLPKANIVSKKIAEGGASLMPPGLTAAWTDRERLNLYAFLGELGRPGPFDASKNNVARVWQLTDSGKVDGALKPEAAASTPSIPSTVPAIYAYTLVDGRLTKELLAEKIAMLQPKNEAVHLTARFQSATAGKTKLNLTGIRKAWLDGQPLAIASEPSPSVEMSAGAHTFTIEVDAKSPPEVLRIESPAVSFLGD